MCVFAQFEDGAGDADFQVIVVSASTGQVVFHWGCDLAEKRNEAGRVARLLWCCLGER
jgi:hypothetical protein